MGRFYLAEFDNDEITFVVDVTSFTKSGFVCTTGYEGKELEIEFDGDGEGIFLEPEMAERVGAKESDPISIIVEGKTHSQAATRLAAIGRKVRISEEKVYYAVGREGGAILRVRKL